MGMSRPLTRAQVLENRTFLSALRRTGNVRLACREVGLAYGTMQDRRRKHGHFASAWAAAVVAAQARLLRSGRGPLILRRRAAPPFQCSSVPRTGCALQPSRGEGLE